MTLREINRLLFLVTPVSTRRVLYNFYIINLVFILADLNRKTMKFKVEIRLGKNQQTKGTYLVCGNHLT